MPADIGQIHAQLQDLGARIGAKVEELRREGMLHGAAREEAAELQIRHEGAMRRAESLRGAAAGHQHGELAADVAILKHTFERWIASVDRKSEH